MIPERLFEILKSANDNEDAHFPSTDVFNEGWMLRLILDAIQSNEIDNDLRFLPGSRWYSEARLYPPFQPVAKPDALGEGPTRADGVIGHFDFRDQTKAGLRLKTGADQFVVIEAKMFSNLSRGTKNALEYNQAARNVACMAHTIEKSGIRVGDVGDLKSVGFFVIAPHRDRRSSRNTNLESSMRADAIRSAVKLRIDAYQNEMRGEEAKTFRIWERDYFHPLVDRLSAEDRLKVLCWDDTLQEIANVNSVYGDQLKRFYKRCLSFEPQFSNLTIAPSPISLPL